LPPTGRLTASASSKPAAKGKAHQRRLARTRRLFAFDRGLGSRLVAGADEAGRGCLAGPLVAAAVLIDYETLTHADRRALAGLHDSKQMTAEKRAELFPCVLRAAARVSVVIRCARGIDDRGLHVTNIEALANALERLRPEQEATCLVDGFSLRDCSVPHRAVIEGDGTSAAIAASSVIAKVTRDRYMHGAGRDHPGWGFEEHVGYSTPEHREAIERIGISPLHRRSFQSVAYAQLELAG
jgi:ribonuclease HII